MRGVFFFFNLYTNVQAVKRNLLQVICSRTVRSLPLVRVNLLARHSARASNVSTNGAGSMITDSGWLAFLDSELCIMRCGDEFSLEFNCKGALKPVL